jgi:hypothetical protein
VASACSDDRWPWPGVAWCRWPLALGLALWTSRLVPHRFSVVTAPSTAPPILATWAAA